MTTHAQGWRNAQTHGRHTVPFPCPSPAASCCRSCRCSLPFLLPSTPGLRGCSRPPTSSSSSCSKVLTPLGPQATWDLLAVSEHPCQPGHGAQDTDNSAVSHLPVHLPHSTRSSLIMGTTLYTFSTLNAPKEIATTTLRSAFYRASP